MPGDNANVHLEWRINPNANNHVRVSAAAPVPLKPSKHLNVIVHLRRIISQKSDALYSYDFIAELDLHGLEILKVRGNLLRPFSNALPSTDVAGTSVFQFVTPRYACDIRGSNVINYPFNSTEIRFRLAVNIISILYILHSL